MSETPPRQPDLTATAPGGGDRAALRTERLRHFAPRRARSLRGGRWYSRLVATAKLTLPVLALVALGTTLLWDDIRRSLLDTQGPETASLNGDEGSPALAIDPTNAGTGAAAPSAIGEVMNPRYESTDSNDNPFSLTAEQATQVPAETNVMAMDAPQADFLSAAGEAIELVADAGRYDEVDDRMLLGGAVQVSHQDGSVFSTEAAAVDIGGGQAWGDRPVTGSGPFGEVEAEGFRIFDRGAAVVFVGQSRLVLPQGGPSDDDGDQP